MTSDGKLGRFIKSQRKRLGIELEDLAKGTGLSLSLVKAIEEGERKASMNVVDKMMKYWKVKGVSHEKIFNLWEG